jgi:hypothetical protein
MKEFFVKAFVVNPAVVDDGLVRERFELMKLQNPQVMKTMKVPNMTARLGEIACPALTLWGLNENMMPETGIMRVANHAGRERHQEQPRRPGPELRALGHDRAPRAVQPHRDRLLEERVSAIAAMGRSYASH